MMDKHTSYSRADILNLKNSNSNGLHSKKTKRGCRAGKHKTRQRAQQSAPDPIPAPAKKFSQSHPVVLYTNCRSLNNWKLDELTLYAHTHKPHIICQTETWIDDTKEQSTNIDGYNSYFCNRKNRIGGGVAIFIDESFTTKVIASHSTKTVSAKMV